MSTMRGQQINARVDDDVARAADREYAALGPLQVRIDTHRQYSRRPEDVDASVLAALSLTGTESVLDVGSGTAAFVRRLVADGHSGQVMALDLSLAAYQAAQAIPGVKAFHASADVIPLADGAVDVVAARHVLYHCADPAAVVAECRRVLAEDGVFIATVNHPDAVPMIRHLLATELAMLGTRIQPIVNGITTNCIADLVGEQFADVEVRRFDNDLVFEDPDPLVAFAEAHFTLYGIDVDHAHREELSSRMCRRVEDWFAVSDEPWIEPKGFSVCLGRGRVS